MVTELGLASKRWVRVNRPVLRFEKNVNQWFLVCDSLSRQYSFISSIYTDFPFLFLRSFWWLPSVSGIKVITTLSQLPCQPMCSSSSHTDVPYRVFSHLCALLLWTLLPTLSFPPLLKPRLSLKGPTPKSPSPVSSSLMEHPDHVADALL